MTIIVNHFVFVSQPVAYLGFHFGGVQKFSGKVGYLHGAKRHAARGEAPRLLGGFGGMLPRKKKIKNGAIWCVLESILLKFCQKNNFKKIIFYIKITDNVLLRAIIRGIAAYSPDFLSLVRFGVFWSTVSVNFLLRKYYNYLNNIDIALLRTSYM